MKEDTITILDRIEELIAFKHLSHRAFAKSIGVPPMTLSSMIKRRSDPSALFIATVLSVYSDVSPDWLLLGGDGMLRDSKVCDGISDQVSLAPPVEESFVYKLYKEKDVEVGQLKEEIGILKSKILQLEADNESLKNQVGADKITDTFTDIPSVDYEEDYIPTKRSSESKRPLTGKA